MSTKTKYVTPLFRGSFVYLNEPHSPPVAQGETPKEVYSISIVLPKKSKEHMAFKKKMDRVVLECITDAFGDPKEKKYKWTNPIKNGDDEVIEQWEDAYVIKANSKSQPGVVGRDKKPIIDPTELYSGAHYRASIEVYPWNHPTGGKGVSFSLSNVMKVKDDDAFDGRTSAEEDFADIDYEDDFEDDDDLI